MPESALPYGQYMYLGSPNPPKGWVTVRPNKRIMHSKKMIQKFIPQEPRLSDEDYANELGNFPYNSPVSLELREHDDGITPTVIKESFYPKADYKNWLTYDDGSATDPHPHTGDQGRTDGIDTQSGEQPKSRTHGDKKRITYEPTKFQTFGDGKSRLT